MTTENTAVPATATKTEASVEPSELAVLREKNAVLESVVAELTTENAQLKAQLAEKGSVKILKEADTALTLPTDTFDYKGKKYRFVLPAFRIAVNGLSTKVLAATALKDDEMLDIIMEDYRDLVKAV